MTAVRGGQLLDPVADAKLARQGKPDPQLRLETNARLLAARFVAA